MYYYYYYWKICSVLWLIAVCVYYIWQVSEMYHSWAKVHIHFPPLFHCSVFHRDTGRMNCRHEEVKLNLWFPLNKLSLQRHYGERERERDSLAWKLLFIFQTCLLHWSLSVWAFHSASPGLWSVLTRLQETFDLCCCRHRWPPTRRSRWNHHVHTVFFSFCCLCCTSLWRNMRQRCMVFII